MPKPGRGYNQPWKKQYNEHDTRTENPHNANFTSNIRRVTFKHSRFNKKGPHKDWSNSVRAHLEDEDVDMGNVALMGFKKHHRKGGRPGSPAPHKIGKRKLLESPTNWFRVTLPYGNKYDKDYILRTLLEKVTPIPFVPISWSVNGISATFYVDDYKLAEKLHMLDRQIQCSDGFKMIIKVHSGSPNVDINAPMKEKMKLTMAKRYNAASKALDLTRFHADPDLQDIFCALFKPVVLLAVIDIISENIPELEALNLFDNRIHILSHLRKLDKKLPNLKILHLGNNKLREISMLESLSGVPIVDIVLAGNPLCDKFRDHSVYATQSLIRHVGLVLTSSVYSEVRKRFPKVVKLDGIELPPPMGFDVSEEVQLPPSQQTFLCSVEAQGIVRQFLEEYFLIFDSDNRQPLLQAYHENAVFSMTMGYPYGQNQKSESWLNWYATDNRNLMRLHDSDRRHKLLRQGQLSVVSFLAEMPSTKHDIHSCTIDLTLFTPQMLMLTVTGLFKELRTGHKTPPIRYFCRSFVIVPGVSGLSIANEQLHVSNATEQHAKLAFKTPVIQTSAVATPTSSAASSSMPTPAAAVPPSIDDNMKQQMIATMAQHSGMNLEWSQKCLIETNWDFNRAAFIFTELQKQGTIPAAAFVK